MRFMIKSPKSNFRVLWRRVAVALVATTLFALAYGVASAQPGPRGPLGPPPGPRPGRGEVKRVPSERYYAGTALIESGQFSSAIRFYNSEIKDAVKIGPSLWIDSICYYAMLGETYYQAGDLDSALKNFNSSLTLAMAFPNWMAKVTYVEGVSGREKGATPWGVSRRATPIGVFPSKATIIIGEGETQATRQLGIVAEQHAMAIDPIEILRCIALSIRRRVDIIGPLAPYDPMSTEILETFRTRAVAPNHWSIVFLDVIWGLALEECDKTQSAVKALNEALLAMGRFDHQLTGDALLELGHIFLKVDKVREAAQCYYEAAHSAWQFGDRLLLEEALRRYSNCSKALRGGAADPALVGAYRWSKTQRGCVLLQTSLALELLEDMIYSGRIPQAKSGLSALQASMRGEVRNTIHADRWNYLHALFLYATGETERGDEALALVVEGAKVRSTWARQLGKLDAFVQRGLTANGALTPRNAADLYEYLLREPTVVDWAVNPTESLSIQMIAPLASYERQFQLLLDRDLKDKAFEVSERIRRERFFSTQTYGGRLVSLRYIMTADDLLTTPSLRAARETLAFAYPNFEETMKATASVMEFLNGIPTVPTDRDDAKRQEALFADLAKIAVNQEAMLHFIAAGRVRIPYVFPPVYSVEEVQKRLPADTAILSFIEAEGEIYGFMIGKENLDAWRIGASDQVAAAVATFLKTIGNSDGSRYVENEQLNDELWKAQGARLREILLGASDVEADRFNIVFSKLVVTPDSSIWYLPFEALCLPKAASTAADEENEGDGEENPESETETDGSDGSDDLGDEATDEEKEEAERKAREEQYNDLDAGYYDDEAEDADVSAVAEILADEDEENESDGETPDPATESADEPEQTDESADVEETPTEAAPTKRMSRNAREKAALKAFEDTLMPMIAAQDFTIRYSATVSLALPNAVGRSAFVGTTLIWGQTFPKEPAERIEAAVERFSRAISKTEATTAENMRAIPGSLYAARLRRLVVWEEVLADKWNWSPVVLGNRPRPGNSVSAWIESPWGAPRLIVMPALRTPAENSLKGGGIGAELALAVLAMQASGADTMLLSRWRTGGRSAYDLTQDFVKNYENEPAADAWKNAVLSLMARDVIPDEEPRLKKLGRSEEIPKYSAPFWWAGYMLIDSGEAVEEDRLEEFDVEAVKKGEEENALLESDKDAEKKSDDSENELDGILDPSDEEDEGDRAVFVEPKKSDDDDAPFASAPKSITDEDLAAQDEEGDDFFAIDSPEDAEVPDPEDVAPDEDEPDAAIDEEPDATTDSKTSSKTEPKSDAKSDSKASTEPEPKSGAKSEPKASSKSEPKSDAKNEPKTSTKSESAPKAGTSADSKEDGKSNAKDSGKSSGRLSIKGKGGK